MTHLTTLSFLGGAITVEASGPKAGQGTFSFPEDDVVISDDGDGTPQAIFTVPLSELREMHAWLGKTLAQIDKNV